MRCFWIIIACALAFSAYVAFQNRDVPHFGLQHDDSIYVVGAKSLAEGHGYRILSLPGEPYQTKYPPGFSGLLALLWRINPHFPQNLSLFLAVTWLALPVLIAIVWFWLRRPFVCLLLAINAYYLFYSLTLGTDLIAAAAMLGALWMAEKPKPINVVAAGALTVTACLVRMAALPLLVSVPCVYLWQRRRKDAAVFLAVAMPCVLAWLLWARSHASQPNPFTAYYTSYTGFYFQSFTWKDVALMPWKNLGAICLSVSRYVFFDIGYGADWQRIFETFLTVVCLSGIIRFIRQTGHYQYAVFAALYTCQLMIWNLPDERFLLPFAPLIYAGLITEFTHAWTMIRRTWLSPVKPGDRPVAAILAVALFCMSGASLASNLYAWAIYMPSNFSWYRERFRERKPLFEWLANWSQRDAIIISSKDPVLYLYTGLHGASMVVPAGLQYDPTPARFVDHFLSYRRFARGTGANYLLMEPKLYELYVPPQQVKEISAKINRDPGLEPVYQTGSMTLYRIISSLSRSTSETSPDLRSLFSRGP